MMGCQQWEVSKMWGVNNGQAATTTEGEARGMIAAEGRKHEKEQE
jgi:hypothetical protein